MVDAIKSGQKIAFIGASGPHVFDENGDVTGYYREWAVMATRKEVKVSIRPL